MGNIKLSIDEFEENNFYIIAIHTPLEDFRLAYFLNLNLNIFLSKNNNDIESHEKERKIFFTRFSFENKDKFTNWDLVQNKSEIEITNDDVVQDLFSGLNNKFSTTVFLVPEFKKVDYILKIESAEKQVTIDAIVSKINSIESVKMVYTINHEKIKSKNNLIF